MNKAWERSNSNRRQQEVIFVQSMGKASHLIKDLEGKILFTSNEIHKIVRWLNNNPTMKIVRREEDRTGRGQAKGFIQGSRNKGVKRPIPIRQTQQYAEHHEEARQHKLLVKRVAAKFGVKKEVAEQIVLVINDSTWDTLSEEQCEEILQLFV
jgi:hypothetical protein